MKNETLNCCAGPRVRRGFHQRNISILVVFILLLLLMMPPTQHMDFHLMLVLQYCVSNVTISVLSSPSCLNVCDAENV